MVSDINFLFLANIKLYNFVFLPPCALFKFDCVAENDGQSFKSLSPGSLLAYRRNSIILLFYIKSQVYLMFLI